jgi:diguanylate cyclase (GGDEF)-like protein/PAS domain S-box-containing protein
MRAFTNLTIRTKAFAASLVLLLCLIGVGGNAYYTSDRAATAIEALIATNLPRQQGVAKLETDVTAIHLKVFRYVSWASNSVSESLLRSLRAETRSDLRAIKDRIEAIRQRGDLAPAERELIETLARHWKKYSAAANDTLDVGTTDAPMATMMLGGTDDDFQKVGASLETLSAFVDGQTTSIGLALAANAKDNQRILAFGGAAGILLSFLVTLMVSRSIVQPIRYVTRAMQHLSSEKFDLGATYMDRADEVGQMVRAIASYRDNLQIQNLRFDAALNNMAHGLAMFDAEKCLVVANKRYAAMYGLSAEDIKPGTPLRQILDVRIKNGVYARMTDNDVRERLTPTTTPWTRVEELSDGRSIVVSGQPMPSGGWVTTHEDITERRRAEAKISHLARHDLLTNLPNRVLFREHLEDAVSKLQPGRGCAVLCLDLDRFKNVNDTLGHPVGDELLKAVAGRLLSVVQSSDMVARIGGDEFAIVKNAVERPEQCSELAARIVEVVGRPYEVEGRHIEIGTSVGIAIAPNDGANPDQLLKSADMALYLAKSDGRGTHRFFEREMDKRLQARHALEIDLRSAIVKGEFELHYQPIIRLSDGHVSGFEALVRWNHPARGQIPPLQFIPLAEETGLILSLGEWVLRTACAHAAKWPEPVSVAVNLSAAQFKGRNLVQIALNALAASSLAPDRLDLEITESVLLKGEASTLSTLHQLRDLGVRISMDDFGTGYSSLAYLRSFPFDKIKIDRQFVRDMPERNDSRAIVRAVASLASSLRIATIIEGIETEEQLELAKTEGCGEAQGFLFSKPMPEREIPEFLAKRRRIADAA